MLKHQTAQWRSERPVKMWKDTGCISDISRVSDVRLYSRQSKGQSFVLTFSKSLELTSRCRFCYGNRRKLDGAQYGTGKRILNGVSTRFWASWPFGDGLNERYFPLGAKRKGVSAGFLPWMGALLSGGARERRPAVSPPLSLSNVSDKVWPSPISQSGGANRLFSPSNRNANASEMLCSWDGALPNAGWAMKCTLCASIAPFCFLIYTCHNKGSRANDQMEPYMTNVDALLPHKAYIYLTLLRLTRPNGQNMRDLCCLCFCNSKDILI